jgi:EAL domain-containing protein (putative c-di-GMP-specific phosphodiesterase class I)
VTETSPVVDNSRLNRSLRRLRAAGHEVMMDDFTLDDVRRRLLRLPFSGVKLDRSLVQQLPHSGRARNQVRALCRLG